MLGYLLLQLAQSDVCDLVGGGRRIHVAHSSSPSGPPRRSGRLRYEKRARIERSVCQSKQIVEMIMTPPSHHTPPSLCHLRPVHFINIRLLTFSCSSLSSPIYLSVSFLHSLSFSLSLAFYFFVSVFGTLHQPTVGHHRG